MRRSDDELVRVTYPWHFQREDASSAPIAKVDKLRSLTARTPGQTLSDEDIIDGVDVCMDVFYRSILGQVSSGVFRHLEDTPFISLYCDAIHIAHLPG